MAKRLTQEDKDILFKIFMAFDKEDLEQLDIMLFCLSSETKHQLKQLQKLYKKYDIKNVEELDKKLSNFDNFMKGNKFETIEDLQNALNGKFIEVFDEKNKIWQDMVKNLTKTEQDRDTWKRACELAIRDPDSFHCPNPPEYYNAQDEYGSDEPYYIQDSVCEFADTPSECLECRLKYFYQQAKNMESNNENH